MKNITGTILRLNKKNFEDEELSYKLFLTTRQTSKTKDKKKYLLITCQQTLNLLKLKYLK